jgi:flagellar basal-body rod protein FlgB
MSASALAAAGGGAGIFTLAERKLEWIDQRQRILAQNIANADTPDYQPRDLAPFESHLRRLTVIPARTNPLHLAGFTQGVPGADVVAAEHAPDGNAVNLEDQMTKVADDENSQALAGNLWKSYMGMFMTALGHGS